MNSDGLYFAYGANMQRGGMAQRCPGAIMLGRARLPHHAFVINSQGLATVVPKMHATVHGILWQITPAHEAALDIYEGVDWGLYAKTTTTIIPEYNHQRMRAMLYLAQNSTPGYPRIDYLSGIIYAAERERLPQTYVAELQSWLDYEPAVSLISAASKRHS